MNEWKGNLSREMITIKKNWMKILALKTTIYQNKKKVLDGLIEDTIL